MQTTHWMKARHGLAPTPAGHEHASIGPQPQTVGRTDVNYAAASPRRQMPCCPSPCPVPPGCRLACTLDSPLQRIPRGRIAREHAPMRPATEPIGIVIKNDCNNNPSTFLAAAPLLPPAAGLIIGVVLDDGLTLPFGVYLAGLTLLTALQATCHVRAALAAILTVSAAICAGGLLSIGATRTPPPDGIEFFAGDTPHIARVRGTIASEPRVLGRSPNPFARWTFAGERTTFLLDASAIEGHDGDISVSGLVRVTVGEAVLDVREGERIEAFGWLRRPQPPQNPGGFDWAAYNLHQGVAAGMVCDGRETLRRAGPASPGLLVRFRRRARGLLTDDLTTGAAPEAGLLEAMVLGHRSRLDRQINECFVRAGCVHFLAVSGLHLAVPLSFVWWLGRRAGFTRRRCAWMALVTIDMYALLAEPRPPILRAATMGTLLCLSLLLRRSAAGLNWVAAAAIILVAISPLSVFDPGFQLSFGAIVGIVCLPGPLRGAAGAALGWFERTVLSDPYAADDRLLVAAEPGHARRRLLTNLDRWLVVPLLVAVSAWLACMPIVATHFQSVHWWAPINSLLVFPLVYVLILLGFAKMGIEALVPGWGPVLSDPMSWVDERLLSLVECLGNWPGATVPITTPPWWWTATWYLCLVAFVIATRVAPTRTNAGTRPQRPRSRTARMALATSLVALIGASCAWAWPAPAPGRLTVDVLAVGAGTAVVMELPDGRVILYDAGSASPYDIGQSVLVPFLKHRRVKHIDRVYLSHPNLDHLSGLLTLIEQIETGPVVVNEHFRNRSGPKSPSRYLLDRLADRKHTVEVMDPSNREWTIADVRFERLWPEATLDDNVSSNDASTVLRVSFHDHSILLTGDIEDVGQRALLERGDIGAEVLLLPHHGSVRKSTPAFLAAVGADWLVRSSKEPMAETVNGLDSMARDTPIVNTADVGAIRVVIDDDGVTVRSLHEGG